MNPPTAFLKRVRTERRALKTVNEAADWPRLYGVGDEPRRAWEAALAGRVDPTSLKAASKAIRRVRSAALLGVDRSRFVGTYEENVSASDVAAAIEGLSDAVRTAAESWDGADVQVPPALDGRV